MKKRSILVVYMLLFGLLSTVTAQVKIDTAGLQKLKSGLKSMSKQAGLEHALWGFCLMDPKTGNVLAGYEENKSLTPASSQKVFTTLSALHYLGADYRFETYLEYDGILGKDSVLQGNIYIRGTGDPTLGSMRIDSIPADTLLAQWAHIIRKKGINRITGSIIADASAWEDYATVGSWNWDDIGQYYGAGASALNFMENTYTVYYSSTTKNATIDSVVPEIEGLTFWNDVTVSGSSDNAFIYGAPDNYYRYITGTIPANKKGYAVDGSMPDPPLFLALKLKQALIQSGIPVEKQATTVYALRRAQIPVNPTRRLLYTHTSPTIGEIVKATNMKSNNLYAECLLKAVAKQTSGNGSRSAGADAVTQYCVSAGVDVSGVHIEDGSGLSRLNYFTPKSMCQLLTHANKSSYFSTFYASLPIAGKTGTLKSFADNTSAEGDIIAKSGSMYKVRSYSGYVKTSSGELLTFCVLVNNYSYNNAEIRSALEKLAVLMAGL